MPPVGLEPTLLAKLDFESSASTNSATGAMNSALGRDAGSVNLALANRLLVGHRPFMAKTPRPPRRPGAAYGPGRNIKTAGNREERRGTRRDPGDTDDRGDRPARAARPARSPRTEGRPNASGAGRQSSSNGRPVRERDNSEQPRRAGKAPTRSDRTASGPRRSSADTPQRATRERAAPAPDKPERIAKLLARAGVASRRDIERMIAEGRIALNGKPVEHPATILKTLEGVTVDGLVVRAARATRVFLFHKPAGCLTTARDPKGRATIFDLLPKDLPRLVTIGRLDMNTEGLLLLTNDGELKRALELPSSAVPRQYRVRAHGTVTQAMLEQLAEGITVENVRYGPIIADIERRMGSNVWLTMTLTEGKNREIRRVLEYLGLEVTRLIRVAYGPCQLADLPPRGIVEVDEKAVDGLITSLKSRKA